MKNSTLKNRLLHLSINCLSSYSFYSNTQHLLHCNFVIAILLLLVVILLISKTSIKQYEHQMHIINYVIHLSMLLLEPIYVILALSEFTLLTIHHLQLYPHHKKPLFTFGKFLSLLAISTLGIWA